MEIRHNGPEADSENGLERSERIQSLRLLVAEALEKGKDKGYWDEDEYVVALKSSKREDSYHISQKLKPEETDERSFGLNWEYYISADEYVEPDEYGQRYQENYYFFTTDGEVRKVSFVEEDHLPPPDGKKPKNFLEFLERSEKRIEITDNMYKNVMLEIELGQNGLPVTLEEVDELESLFVDAEIIDASSFNE